MQKYSKPTHNQFLQLVLSECLEYVQLNDIIFYHKHQYKKNYFITITLHI